MNWWEEVANNVKKKWRDELSLESAQVEEKEEITEQKDNIHVENAPANI